jgi:hypothetical protein
MCEIYVFHTWVEFLHTGHFSRLLYYLIHGSHAFLWGSQFLVCYRMLWLLLGFDSTRWRSWLRHCATSRKVAGSIPDCVTGIFHWHNTSGRSMALGLTQPLTEMSTRNNSWGKGGWCVGLTTLPPSCADCLEIWEPQPPGTLRACPGL